MSFVLKARGLKARTLAGCLVLSCIAASPTGAQTAASKAGLDYEAPAAGCPQQVPTHESAERYCKQFDKASCKADKVCSWQDAVKQKDGSIETAEGCETKLGMSMGYPSPDPSQPSFFEVIRLASDGRFEKMANRAHEAAANGRFDEAISIYSSSLRTLPEHATEFHSRMYTFRGLAHEHKKDPKRALGDYCSSLIYSSDWQAEQIARTRIAQIAQPDAPRVPIVRFQKSAVLRSAQGRGLAPLNITTPDGMDYVIKVVHAVTDDEVMLIYVRSNSTFSTTIPLGKYRIRGAYGPAWYGAKDLFGEQTRYFKLDPQDGPDILEFYRKGNQYSGKSLLLTKQKGGNLLTPEIKPDKF